MAVSLSDGTCERDADAERLVEGLGDGLLDARADALTEDEELTATERV